MFERNAFTPVDTERTAAIFLFYAPQLPLTAVDYLLINAFYARQNARTPVIVGVVCVFIYLAVALSTIGTLQARGLALANAVQNSSHAIILLVLLRRSLPGLRLGAALWPFLVRVVPTAGVMASAVAGVADAEPPRRPARPARPAVLAARRSTAPCCCCSGCARCAPWSALVRDRLARDLPKPYTPRPR